MKRGSASRLAYQLRRPGSYPVLKAMEEAGRVRAAISWPASVRRSSRCRGRVDRLRAARETDSDGGPDIVVLAAADPAQPYGATLSWPRDAESGRLPLARVPGSYVVLADGAPALYVERGGRDLLTLPALATLPRLLAPSGPLREIRLERVDRVPPAESALADALRGLGFRPSYRCWLLRP